MHTYITQASPLSLSAIDIDPLYQNLGRFANSRGLVRLLAILPSEKVILLHPPRFTSSLVSTFFAPSHLSHPPPQTLQSNLIHRKIQSCWFLTGSTRLVSSRFLTQTSASQFPLFTWGSPSCFLQSSFLFQTPSTVQPQHSFSTDLIQLTATLPVRSSAS